MADPLPPREPDPIPSIHRVPERLAGPLAAVYKCISSALRVPSTGAVTTAFAHDPTVCAGSCRGMHSIAQTQALVDACTPPPGTGETRARRFEPTGVQP